MLVVSTIVPKSKPPSSDSVWFPVSAKASPSRSSKLVELAEEVSSPSRKGSSEVVLVAVLLSCRRTKLSSSRLDVGVSPGLLEDVTPPELGEEVSPPELLEEVSPPEVPEVEPPEVLEDVSPPELLEDVSLPELVDEVSPPGLLEVAPPVLLWEASPPEPLELVSPELLVDVSPEPLEGEEPSVPPLVPDPDEELDPSPLPVVLEPDDELDAMGKLNHRVSHAAYIDKVRGDSRVAALRQWRCRVLEQVYFLNAKQVKRDVISNFG